MGKGPLTADEKWYVIDTSDFPVVRMIFPRISSRESIDRSFDNMLAVATNEPIAIVADTRPLDVTTVTPKIRKHYFDKVNEYSELRGRYIVGEAVLASNWMREHFYQAYLWMKSERVYPTKAFREEIEALEWCRKRLADASVEQAG